jgi:hypothetical protein
MTSSQPTYFLEEAQLTERTLDIALFDFGEKYAGRTLSASDIHVLFGAGIIMDEGLVARYLVLIGWWTVFFPWDWEAALHFSTVDLLWFMLKHVTTPGFDQSKQHVTPFRMGMASLAMTKWDRLKDLCAKYGVLAGDDWPSSRPATHGEQYAFLRKVRQAMYSCMILCIPLWTAWLTGGYLRDEELGQLFESLGGVVTERTLGRLNAVQSLTREDIYYVDLSQWTVALGGSEAAALIPVICGVLFGRVVQVPVFGRTVAALYEDLALAIKGQTVPRRIYPLRWYFKTIVWAYNNFPEMNELYSFRESIQPFPLNHGRRVLLSAMFLRGRTQELDADS